MELDEKINLSVYCKQWVQQFVFEKSALLSEFHAFQPMIEHIGSTAVHGMTAKPIIDILLGFAAYPPPPETAAIMRKLGYIDHGEAGVQGRRYYTKRLPDVSFNAHLCAQGGNLWRNNILLRDYLQCHSDDAHAYADLKVQLIQSGTDTLLAYSEAKAGFIAELLRKAEAEAF